LTSSSKRMLMTQVLIFISYITIWLIFHDSSNIM
jgi:hypothetical protein